MKQQKKNTTEVAYGNDFCLHKKYFEYNSTNSKRSPYHLWLAVALRRPRMWCALVNIGKATNH